MLATPLTPGDIARRRDHLGAAARRRSTRSAFLVVMLAMGLVTSWWALLALPAALLIGFAFGGGRHGAARRTCAAGRTSSYITLVQLPLFLFSATFFPITRLPGSLQWVVRLTPLYHGVGCCGSSPPGRSALGSLWHVLVLVLLGVVGLVVTGRRLEKLLLK